MVVNIQQKVELLRELRASLIYQCVTKGLNPNVEMKDSGVAWIGMIPKHWDCRRLKFVAKPVIEKRIPIEGDKKISPENVESESGRVLNYYSNYETTGNIFRSGDILFSRVRVYLNKVVLCDCEGLCMGSMIVIRPNHIQGGYLHRILNSKGFIEYVNSLSEGVTFPNLSVDNLFDTLVPLPPQTEQMGITNHLNENIRLIDHLSGNF